MSDWAITLAAAKYYGHKSGVAVLGAKNNRVKLIRGDRRKVVDLQSAMKEIDSMRQFPENKTATK
jgi:hypothetical protein